MSPIVDITYSSTHAKEKCLDVLIQDVRINLSVPFLMHLGRYFLDSLPGEQVEKGIINHGYDNNNQMVNRFIQIIYSLSGNVNISILLHRKYFPNLYN